MKEKTAIYGLYSTSNVGEFRYIGKTCGRLANRLREHLRDSSGNPYKYNWIKKETSKGHRIKIKLIKLVDSSCWEKEEIYYISYYKKEGHRLTNISPGGNVSKESKAVIAIDRFTGKKLKTFSSIRAASRFYDIYENSIRDVVSGRKRFTDNKVFILKSNFSKKIDYKVLIKCTNVQLKKYTYQYDLQGNFLKEWSSAKEATTFYSLGRSAIPLSATGRQITAGGYIWLYEKNEEEVNNRLRKLKKVPNENAVNVYYKDSGELVGSFYNKASACKMLGLNYKQFLKGICERGFYKNYKV